MQQNATDSSDLLQLTAKQLRAIELLLTGDPIAQIAREVEVDRATVYRWLRNDFAFQACLNRGRRLIQNDVETRLLAICGRAVDNVARAVEDGDLKTSLGVLKGTGNLSGEKVTLGEEDPDLLRQDAELTQIEKNSSFATRELMATLDGIG